MVPFVALNGVMPPSGQVNTRAIVGGKDNNGIVGDADVIQMLQQRTDVIIQLRHTAFFEAVIAIGVHHRLVLLREERVSVHPRSVVPDKERFPSRFA